MIGYDDWIKWENVRGCNHPRGECCADTESCCACDWHHEADNPPQRKWTIYVCSECEEWGKRVSHLACSESCANTPWPVAVEVIPLADANQLNSAEAGAWRATAERTADQLYEERAKREEIESLYYEDVLVQRLEDQLRKQGEELERAEARCVELATAHGRISGRFLREKRENERLRAALMDIAYGDVDDGQQPFRPDLVARRALEKKSDG